MPRSSGSDGGDGDGRVIIAFYLLKFYFSVHAGVEQMKRVAMSIEDLI